MQPSVIMTNKLLCTFERYYISFLYLQPFIFLTYRNIFITHIYTYFKCGFISVYCLCGFIGNTTWQSPLLLTDCLTKIKFHSVLVISFLFSTKKATGTDEKELWVKCDCDRESGDTGNNKGQLSESFDIRSSQFL